METSRRAYSRIRRHWVSFSALGCVVVVAIVVMVGFLVATPSRDWSRPAASLLPQRVAGQQVDTTPDSSGLLEQIQSLAPDVSGSAASVVDPQGAATQTLLVLTGPRNSLNSVQLRIAQALGAGRKADEWDAGGIGGTPSVALTYQKSDFKIDDLRVDRVASVSQSGAVTQQWLMVRSTPRLLLAVRDLTGDDAKARAALGSMLAQAED